MKLLYKVNDKPPFGITLILAIQHLLASVGGIVAVPLILGPAIGLPVQESVALISAALMASGAITVLQCLGFGPVGIRLPVVMGSSFAFIGIAVSIGKTSGIAGVMGAALAGSFVVILCSFFMDKIQKLFPPVVSGVVVALIGLTILPVAMKWIGDASGANAEDFATPAKLFLALFSLGIVVLISMYGKGILCSFAIIIGIIAGYLVAIPLGFVHFESLVQAKWFSLPQIAHYGFHFSWGAVISMSLAYIVVVAEAIGDFLALAHNSGVTIDGKDLRRGVLCDGIGSIFASIFSAAPLASFSQNIGIVGITGVASRFVVAMTGLLLLVAGFMPKLAALATTIPKPVLGGVGFVMFGMIAYAGIRLLLKATDSRRNALIVCIGLSSGLAVTYEPRLAQHVPEVLSVFFHSGITTGTIVAMLLNLCLPPSSEEDEPDYETCKPQKLTELIAKDKARYKEAVAQK